MNDHEHSETSRPLDETEAEVQFRGYIEEAMAEEKNGSREAAMLAVMRAFTVAAENFEESDTPGDQLVKRQVALEDACDWPGVIALQREIIRYGEVEAPKAKPDAPPHFAPAIACEIWRKLAELLSLVGRNDEALAAADRAIHHARQADMSPLLVHARLQRARCLGRLGRWREALAPAEEALAANDPELPFVDGQIARCWLMIACCHARLQEPAPAREQLALVGAILERPQLNPNPLRAWWHEITAETRRAEGDLAGAITTMQAAVDLLRAGEHSGCGTEVNACAATARARKRLAEYLDELGDVTAATATRRQIDEFAQRFKLPVWS